jgi:glycosyltransferase involved in cell wall biosynthesis
VGIPFAGTLVRLLTLDSSEKEETYFAILMGQDFVKCYPYLCLNRKKRYLYLFDVWPNDLPRFVNFIRQYKIDRVFVSASQSTSELNGRLGRSIADWIPEGVDITAYQQLPYDQRDIDVLQIGRKYDAYHQQILPCFQGTDRVYLYEKTKGTIIFPTREGFINGMARSKISICFPSNITHPERSGAIENMTNRYLQSIASKCLVVGHAPREMVKLFGYNPVVEADLHAPVEQLNTILDHYSDYLPLIEKNYAEVAAHHTWERRWEQIKDRINHP